MVCKLCGTDNPVTNKFCGECGVLLVPKPAAEAVPVPPRPDYEPKAEHFASILEPEETPVVTEPVRPTVPYRTAPESRDSLLRESAIEREPVLVETRTQRAQDHTPLGFEPEGKHYTTISGPSFLGLTDDSPETDSADYLLEDEESGKSRAGWYVFSFVAIAILATIGVLEWKAIKTGKLSIPFFSSTSAEAPKTADQPTAASTPAPAANANSDTNAAKPDSDPAAPPPDETKPDQLTTDHTNAAAATPTQSTSSNPSQTTDGATSNSEPAAAAAAAAPPSEKSAEKTAQPKEASVEKPAATPPPTPIAKTKPRAVREERVPEKPDPKTNRMLIAGEKYLYGRGVPRDCNQALIYFRAAASEDNGPAMAHLGAMYAAGSCVRIDRATAYSWFVRAQEADPGNEWISRNLNMLWRDMSAQERATVSR